MTQKQSYILYLFSALFLITSCQQSSNSPYLPIQLENARSERLLSFYFGSYAEADPFESGLLRVENNQIHIELAQLNTMGLSQALEDHNEDEVIDWEELEPFLASTYYEARNVPPSLEALYAKISAPAADSGWLALEIDGMMVSARRIVYVQESSIQEALLNYTKNNDQILYPIGTTFIGHHYEENQLIETTVSQKREDAFWDFFIYDQDGMLTSNTQTGPKELTAPTRCVGCHFGEKLFEPEVSFPNEAPNGPFGPRGIYVGEESRNQEITTLLDEHAKRSDTVLGLYGTIYTSRLKSSTEPLSDTDKAILEMILP